MQRIKKPEIRSYSWQGDCPLLTFIYRLFDCGSSEAFLIDLVPYRFSLQHSPEHGHPSPAPAFSSDWVMEPPSSSNAPGPQKTQFPNGLRHRRLTRNEGSEHFWFTKICSKNPERNVELCGTTQKAREKQVESSGVRLTAVQLIHAKLFSGSKPPGGSCYFWPHETHFTMHSTAVGGGGFWYLPPHNATPPHIPFT